MIRQILLHCLIFALIATAHLALGQCPMPASTPDGTVDTCFAQFDKGVLGLDGNVTAMALQPDGKVVIAGDFTRFGLVSANKIIRLLDNGRADSSFRPDIKPGAAPKLLLLQPDGRILVGGDNVDTTTRAILTRLNSDGSTDASFLPVLADVYSRVSAAVLDGLGRITLVKSGATLSFSDRIYRLLPTGEIDAAYDNAAIFDTLSWWYTISTLTMVNERVYAGGDFVYSQQGYVAQNLIRLQANGHVDTTFHPQINLNRVSQLANSLDQKIIVGGDSSTFGNARIYLLDTLGNIDPYFYVSIPSYGELDALAVDPSGKVLIGGYFEQINNVSYGVNFTRLNQDGSIDVDFAESARLYNNIYTILCHPDGRYLIGGEFNLIDTLPIVGLARLLHDGHIDGTLTTSVHPTAFNRYTFVAKVRANQKIIVTGSQTQFNNIPTGKLVQLHQDGNLDVGFAPVFPANFQPNLVAEGADSSLYIGGFNEYTYSTSVLYRLLPNGSVDGSYQPTALAGAQYISALASLPNGNLLVSGNLQQGHILRLLPTGQSDPSFTIGSGFNGQVNTLIIQPDGKILVAGYFTTLNGTRCSRLIRLLDDGSRDATFLLNTAGYTTILSTQLLPDGRIVITGDIDTLNNERIRGEAAVLLEDGTTDYNTTSAINTLRNASSTPFNFSQIKSQKDGKLLCTGVEYLWDGSLSMTIVRLNGNGFVDSSFTTVHTSSYVYDIAPQSDGKFVLTGEFRDVNGIPRSYIASIIAHNDLTSVKSSLPMAGLAIYPNPARHSVTVTCVASLSTIRWFGADGKEYKVASELMGGNKVFDVSTLPAGIYTILAQIANNQSQARLVVAP